MLLFNFIDGSLRFNASVWRDVLMLSHNKICELEDFSHPDLREVIVRVFNHERARFGQQFPTGREWRKYWEIGMCVRALSDGNVMRADAEVLGVGAGNEPTSFFLTNHVRRVYATDLYLDENWRESANPGMMLHPERYWPSAWNPRRLVVQHMNALDLKYEDGSFDGIFSSSSLEHFGTDDDIRASLREMARVLKPGGVLSLSTEFRLSGKGSGLPGIRMFDESEVREIIFGAADWVPISPPDFSVSETSRLTQHSFAGAGSDLANHVQTFGEIIFHELAWSVYPRIVLTEGDYSWTSTHVALRKRPIEGTDR